MASRFSDRRITAQGTELLPDDPVRLRRQKIARVTLDSMIQFVGLLDAEGTVLEINKVALDAVGITLADVEGQPFWTTFWWQVSPEINATLRDAIRRAAAGELVRWDAEIYGRAGGKETIIIDASLCPVLDEDGAVVFICAEGRDITEKKAQERELAQKNLELQSLLVRVRELDEIKTQFFANVSHELRTPLALILGPAQRLLDDDGTMELAHRRESAQVISRNARMLLKHVNDLLDMSRLEAGKLKLERQEVDVAAMVRFLASHFAVLADERHLDYAVEAEEACQASVDPDKLQRVLMNLLGNAFKFAPPAGRVRCSLRHSAQELVISVDDSGPGVPPELRQAVFERFRQGDGGINRKAGGTGLGLAIAKEFVEMHQGRIEVGTSELGGARFEVTLPRHRLAEGSAPHAVAQAAAASSAEGSEQASVSRTMLDAVVEELRFARPLPPSPAGSTVRLADEAAQGGAAAAIAGPSPGAAAEAGRPRVLVVEDNPDMNRFVVQCLSAHYDVSSAFDGREGLEKALRFRPSLVVSDIMMPGVSGVEMIAEMRKVPALRAMPILLLSAKADEELMIELLNDGAQDFIVKPFSERELVVRARNLVLAEQTRAQVSGLRDAAESASRAKDEFLAMLGHELRNPLSPILSALQLMKLKGDSTFERERTVIERQVKHLTRLVDDLLDVSRIARGKIELKTEPLELADAVNKGIELAMPLIEQRAHRLTVEVPARGLRIEGDLIRLSQIVSNLLTNAAKYTPPGGTIAIHAHQQAAEVVLAVRDSGIGMTPDVLTSVFDLFVQERQAIDRSQGGLGIGLSIVRSLVEQHGGTVVAHSEGPGRGSEFVVRLPVGRASSAGEAARPHLARPGADAVRILVVDDNEDGAEMLAAALARRGYLTRVAHDAPSALRLAAELAPDIAFLDIGLPVMDGYELAGRLRQLPGLAGLELIALTGYGQDSDRQKTKAAGFLHHLVKPVAIEAIEAALAKTAPRTRSR